MSLSAQQQKQNFDNGVAIFEREGETGVAQWLVDSFKFAAGSEQHAAETTRCSEAFRKFIAEQAKPQPVVENSSLGGAATPNGQPSSDTPTPDFQGIAERAIARGETRILPIEVGGKNPAITWAHQPIHNADKPTWEGLYRGWVDSLAALYPHFNACVVAKPYEHLFNDIDTYKEFRAGYEAFSGEAYPITYTTSARDNRCQEHWLQTDATRQLGNVPQFQVDDLDLSVRQNNYYVLSEGSVHPKGFVYKTIVNTPAIPMPDKMVEYIRHLKTKASATNASKNKDLGIADDTPRNERGLIPQGSVNPWLCDQANILRSNLGMDHILMETTLLALAHKNCEPPIDEAKVRQVARSYAKYEPNTSKPLELNQKPDSGLYWFSYDTGNGDNKTTHHVCFVHPAVNVRGAYRDWVLDPLAPKLGQENNDKNDGWFPLGDPSVIAGPSGGGKTTQILDILVKQHRGEDVFGHPTRRRPFLVVAIDRGWKSAKRTMERIGYNEKEIPMEYIPATPGVPGLLNIKEKIEKDVGGMLPEVVFIEGVDMLITNVNDGTLVTEFLSRMQKLADHYHIALVMSVGSPKQKKGQEYTIGRDCILGSEKWGRLCETVVVMTQVPSDAERNNKNKRVSTVLVRNGPPEEFNLVFNQDGRLVSDTEPRVEKPKAADRLEEAKKWYVALFTDATGQFKKEVPLVEHKIAKRDTSLPEKALGGARQVLGIDYNPRTRVYFFLTDPTANTISLDVKEATAVGAGVTNSEPTQPNESEPKTVAA